MKVGLHFVLALFIKVEERTNEEKIIILVAF